MEVFLDKEFLDALFQKQVQQPQDLIVGEVVEFLSTMANVQVYINLSSQFELLNNPLYKKLTNMGTNLPRLLPGFTTQLDKPETLGRSSYKLFFAETKEAVALMKKSGYLFFSSATIRTHWKTYSRNRTDLEIPIAPEYRRELVNWSFLHSCAHPLRSIVITDRYMLKSRRNVQDNVIPLIKALLSQQPCSNEVEILLIGLSAKEDGRLFPITEIYQDLQSAVGNGDRVKLYILDAGKSFHSRGIVTSYWYINPDTSLDFIFGSGLSRRSDGNIYHGFFFRLPKIRTVKSFLKKVQAAFADNTIRIYEPATHQYRTFEPTKEKGFAALNI